MITADEKELHARRLIAEDVRRNHELAWEDQQFLFMPFRGDVRQDRQEGDERGALLDGTGMRANDKFVNFVRAALFPANFAWLGLKPTREHQGNLDVIRALDVTALRIMEALADSNFYGMAAQTLRDLSVFGNGVMLVQEDRPILNGTSTFGGLLFTAVPIWKTWFITGQGGRIIMVIREFEMPAVDAARWFENPGSRCRDLLDRHKHGMSMEKCKYWHYVFPNDEGYVEGSDKDEERRWKSVWIADGPGEGEKIKTKGFDRNPYVTPRWAVAEGDTYGYGPGNLGRADAMVLNELKDQILVAAGRDLIPPVIVAHDSLMTLEDGVNGQIVMKRPDSFKPEALVTNSRYDVAEQMRQSYKLDVRQAFLGDMLDEPEAEPRSAEAVRARQTRALVGLSAPADQIIKEFLSPAIDIIIHLMERAGALPELTAIGNSLGGNIPIRPMFRSPLFTAQKRSLVDQLNEFLERRFRLVEATGGDTSHLDDIDWDALHEFEMENLDIPGVIRLSQEAIQAKREARASQAARQESLQVQQQQAEIASAQPQQQEALVA